jgi:hypothetical protein
VPTDDALGQALTALSGVRGPRQVRVDHGGDLGVVRDDLTDRLIPVYLDQIPESERREETDVVARWDEAHPRILGALLDLAVQVLRLRPEIKLDGVPRMADFADVLATVDRLLDRKGLDTYRDLSENLASDSVTGDPVRTAIAGAIEMPWTGTW